VITLIHGPAELLRAEALADLRRGLHEDEALADLNTARLDGQQITVADLRNACDTLPFLAERRLVIVEGLLRRLAAPARRPKPAEGNAADEAAEEEPAGEANKAQARQLLAYLDQVPPSTELVFVEEEAIAGGPILRRLLELQRDGRSRIILCAQPKRNDLVDWVRARARLRGVQLDANALADLVDCIGDDLRQLDQELIKLAQYTGGARPVTRGDVRRLVPATRAASIFDLVEALGQDDATTAGRLLQHALDHDGEQPLRLLAMIARQYRLIILAKALQLEGRKPPDIAHELGVQDWTVNRLLAQAGRHTFARLERNLELILAADEAIKTGRLTDREALDVLYGQLMSKG
jgi:DNA polymerase-3 subunit delta